MRNRILDFSVSVRDQLQQYATSSSNLHSPEISYCFLVLLLLPVRSIYCIDKHSTAITEEEEV
jgi:hypothetical protein